MAHKSLVSIVDRIDIKERKKIYLIQNNHFTIHEQKNVLCSKKNIRIDIQQRRNATYCDDAVPFHKSTGRAVLSTEQHLKKRIPYLQFHAQQMGKALIYTVIAQRISNAHAEQFREKHFRHRNHHAQIDRHRERLQESRFRQNERHQHTGRHCQGVGLQTFRIPEQRQPISRHYTEYDSVPCRPFGLHGTLLDFNRLTRQKR